MIILFALGCNIALAGESVSKEPEQYFGTYQVETAIKVPYFLSLSDVESYLNKKVIVSKEKFEGLRLTSDEPVYQVEIENIGNFEEGEISRSHSYYYRGVKLNRKKIMQVVVYSEDDVLTAFEITDDGYMILRVKDYLFVLKKVNV